jgi:nucleoside-diphosphate-sugar epimerase
MLPSAGVRIALFGGAGGIGRALTTALLVAGCAPLVLDLPPRWRRIPGISAAPVDFTDAVTLRDGIAALRGTGRSLDKLVLLAGFTVPLTPLAELLKDS